MPFLHQFDSALFITSLLNKISVFCLGVWSKDINLLEEEGVV